MRLAWVVAAVVVAALAAAGWYYRGSAPLAGAARAVLPADGSQPPSLRAAGVHKCVGTGSTSYIDGPCPAGTREVAATHGTMTVTSFPRTAPSALASPVAGGPIVKPMDPDERDRLRDKAIEDAANRR